MSSFKDVVGHKNIIQYIENAVKTDKVSHAYILNGEKGSGKRLLANLFAMSLQCQNRDEDGDACGKCQSCKQAVSNNQPDIIRVTHEDDRGAAGLCGDPASDRECGDSSSDDPFQMCNAEAEKYQRSADQKISDGTDGDSGL